MSPLFADTLNTIVVSATSLAPACVVLTMFVETKAIVGAIVQALTVLPVTAVATPALM